MRLVHFSIVPAVLLLTLSVMAQDQEPAPNGFIQGVIRSGDTPLPGVSVIAANFITDEKTRTVTDPNGVYVLRVPGAGAYIVETEMAAFAAGVKEADVPASLEPVRLDFDLTLVSRSQPAAPRPGPGNVPRNPDREDLPETRAVTPADTVAQDVATPLDQPILPADLPTPAMSPDTPTESVAVLGNVGQSTFGNNFDLNRERIQELIDERFGAPGGPQQIQTLGGVTIAGGPGGPGGFGGRGGGPGGGFVFRGRGGFNANRPRGMISYSLGNSALDAAPYSLNGEPVAKPSYSQNRLSATVGGTLKIPKIYSSNNTFYAVTLNVARARNPYDVFSTVPTLVERLGDFSQTTVRNGAGAGSPVRIFDPVTHAAISNSIIPPSMIDPAAAGLLNFVPLPNLPGEVQNFHYVTSNRNNSTDVNLRLNHTFGAAPAGRGQRGGFGPRGRGGFGRGGFGGGPARRGPRPSNLNFGFQYRSSSNALNNPFPTMGGTNSMTGLNVSVGYVHSIGRMTDNIQVSLNRNRTQTSNLYAFQQDIAGSLGLTGISVNPFDWGLPNLAFTNFSSLNDVGASLRRNQTIQIRDGMIWNSGRHTLRWGGDFRRIQLNIKASQDARGSFTFTGARTADVSQGAPAPGTGFDLADFLLGLPQSTAIQYGDNSYYFRGNSWDLYFQDDWRIRGNLTFNLGLRYEYVSPFSEQNNRIVNLDVAPGFTAVVPVLPGQEGLFTGTFPKTLVNPDRNNLAPRIGIAWRLANGTVVRAGYGVNYNTGAYTSMVQQLAFQPPFSITQTNIASSSLALTLQNGFPSPPPATVTNNFAVNRNYRLGYVQTWNLDIQQQLRSTGLVLNLDYTGTKGTHLDIIEAPNRTPTGLRIPDVQPFSWQTSEGDSILHAATVRLRRRFQRGISFGGSYTFSKSIDNASNIGGGASVVAQNAFDLTAERGLSSFDQTHRLNMDYVLELPAGHDKHWLSNPSVLRAMLGDWQLSGTWNFASGTPFTARILGSFSDVNRGSNGSLRANATGLPVDISDPSTAMWFNTAAFAVPLPGQFGDVGRNTIRGPGTSMFGMSMNKNVPFAEGRALDLRVQATNLFNTPQFRMIDTTVNSPSFGRVTSAGSMRKIQIVLRYRF